MSMTTTEFDRLHQQIAQAESATRYRYEPQVRRMIERKAASGEAIPEATKRLHQELLCEAIEAQFDNMPV